MDAGEIQGLAERAKQGDSEAFGALYTTYITPMYRFIFLRVKNRALAEDLTQTVFVKALSAIDSYEDQGHAFSSWLYKIARNTVADHWKKKKATLVETPEETFSNIRDPKANAQTSTEQNEQKQALIKALDTLTEEQQTILTLKFLDERSNAEIADITGKTQEAIRAMQYRALQALRKTIDMQSL